MEDKNKTESLKEQEISLEKCKPHILKKLQEYIEKNVPEKTKKKSRKTLEQILDADVDQLSFGESPSFETGYVVGKITAEGTRSLENTTYTNTITLDLQTPEYSFFNMDRYDSMREKYKRAFLRLTPHRFVYTAKKHVTSNKRISKIYVSDYEDEALQDYAMEICEEQLARLNYNMDECQVYDFDFVPTQETQVSNVYPVYITLKDKKGKSYNTYIGCYNASTDDMYCEIDFSSDGILWKIVAAIIIIAPVLAIILAIVKFFL